MYKNKIYFLAINRKYNNYIIWRFRKKNLCNLKNILVYSSFLTSSLKVEIQDYKLAISNKKIAYNKTINIIAKSENFFVSYINISQIKILIKE